MVTKTKYAIYLFLMFSFSFFVAVNVGRADFYENASNEPTTKELKNPPMPDRSIEKPVKEEKEVKKSRPLKSEKITGPTAIC